LRALLDFIQRAACFQNLFASLYEMQQVLSLTCSETATSIAAIATKLSSELMREIEAHADAAALTRPARRS
jgi:hypothetical protein